MIINNFVVSYFLLEAISLALCLPAAVAGWQSLRLWKGKVSAEEQGLLEKKIYLVISLLSLAFFIRLFMVPLWFLTIQSLIPNVPGAMCMAGIHMLDRPFSYWATILKFFLPLAFIYWLALNAADRRIESQPFLAKKLYFLIPLIALMIAESFFDLHFLHMVKPKVVSCCTSMFDLPRCQSLKFIRQQGGMWIAYFYFFTGLTAFSYGLRLAFSKTAKIVSAISAILALIFLVLMLHTKVSPLMLEAPYHQCVFCLWQGFPDIALASVLIIFGLWLTFVCSVLPSLKKYPEANRFMVKLHGTAFILYLLGTAWLTIRFAVKYFYTR